MVHAGLVVEIEGDWLYILYKSQIHGLSLEEEYKDFNKGQWVALFLDGAKILRAQKDPKLEKPNRWNARIEDDVLLVDVNVLKRDFDAYPISKKENVSNEDSNLWSHEINDVIDLDDLFSDDDIPAGTFYQCTVSLEINLEEFGFEKDTNILEDGGFEKILVEILQLSSLKTQLYSPKAPWCYLYRADLPPPPLELGQLDKSKMRRGIIARKIIHADGNIRYFLWSQSTGFLPVVIPKNIMKSFKLSYFEVGRVYLFQTQFIQDEICAVRLSPTEEMFNCEVDTNQHRHRRTDNLIINISFEFPKPGAKMQQDHPFFGQLILERDDLDTEKFDLSLLKNSKFLDCKFIFMKTEEDAASKYQCWGPFAGHKGDFHPERYTAKRRFW